MGFDEKGVDKAGRNMYKLYPEIYAEKSRGNTGRDDINEDDEGEDDEASMSDDEDDE